MTWQTFLFLPIAGIAFGYSGLKLFTLFKLLKAQKGKAPPVKDIPKRIIATILNVLGQKAVLRSPWIGAAHAVIFWGFLVITVGTTEQFLSTLYAGFSWEFIGQSLYSAFVFTHDFFTFAVLLAVGYAVYRRTIVKPSYLGKSKDAMIVLTFTGSLMVSIFLMNSFHFLGDDPWFKAYMPFSSAISNLFGHFGFSQSTYHTLGIVFKWVHMLLVLGFSAYIPNSKHLHILAAGPNTFLQKLTREKGMRPINFEDESVTQYGAAKITDMSWQDSLDYYACTECGRCQEVCPAWNTDKPLSPKKLILDLKENLYRNKAVALAGKYDEVTHVIDEHVTEDVVWACTSCRACEVACPVFIEQVDKIYEMRRNLVMMESRMPSEVQPVFKNMETNGTPWAFSSADRANWAEGLGVQKMSEAGDASQLDVLLWVGCAGSYDDRNKKVLKAFVSLLKKAQVRFAMLGTEEQCTGDPARRIGNEYLYQTLAKANIETLNRYKVTRIVTSCPHCFNTIKNEYPDFGGKYEVLHHSQYLAKLLTEGRLRPTKALEETVTFHDSCYLGRWNNIFEQPRAILGSIPAARVVEMRANHDKGMCCGAGGGRMWMEEKIGKRVNIARTEQAIETKASVVASSCPFCMTMLTDGVKAKDVQDKVRVMDIAEIVDNAT